VDLFSQTGFWASKVLIVVINFYLEIFASWTKGKISRATQLFAFGVTQVVKKFPFSFVLGFIIFTLHFKLGLGQGGEERSPF